MNNKMKKLFLTALIITILIIGASNITFAGMFDLDDETADKQAQNLLEEQKKEEENVVGKSTNNYLSSLKIEGLELTPKFDKQTLEYLVESELNVNSINITAEPEDSRAKIEGTGTVQLKKGENNIRIDVEAESGTVRTYFIKVTTKVENENNEEIDNTTTNTPDESIDTNVNIDRNNEDVEQTKEHSEFKDLIPIIILIAVLALIMILFKKDSSKKRKKHRK